MAIDSFEQIARAVLQTADPVQGKDGRLYLDGTATNAILSSAVAEAEYIGEVFRSGMNCTTKYVTDAKPGDMVRVPMITPYPFMARTLKLGSRDGTPNNGGIINGNVPVLQSDDEFGIFLNQVVDAQLAFPELSKDWLPMYDMAKRIAGFAKSNVEARTASHLAEVIAYSVYRALNSGNNIFTIDKTQENEYANLFTNLNTAFDDGDILTHAHTFGTNGRCIIGRPDFVNRIFRKDSGLILLGGDMAQKTLIDYKFDSNISEKDYVGNAYKGNAQQIDIQMAASYVWSLAERYLGLKAGSLDNIQAVAVHADAFATSNNIDLGMKIVDATTFRGVQAQSMLAWGGECFRKSFLIGDTTLSTTSLAAIKKENSEEAAFTESARVYPIAPESVLVDGTKIYNVHGQALGFIPKPNGGNIAGKTTKA